MACLQRVRKAKTQIVVLILFAPLGGARASAQRGTSFAIAYVSPRVSLASAQQTGFAAGAFEWAGSQNRCEGCENSGEERGSAWDRVDYTETPFLEEITLPLGAFWKGRVELEAAAWDYSMENFLWGVPGSGSLPAWGVTVQSHVLLAAPNQAGVIGINISLHRGVAPEGGSDSALERLGRLMHSLG